jgi:hypothetical protein
MAGIRYLDQSHDRLDSCCAEVAESFARDSVDRFEVMAASCCSQFLRKMAVSLRWPNFGKGLISPREEEDVKDEVSYGRWREV